MDFAAFARLRPLMPAESLIAAVGDEWSPPGIESEGHVSFKADGKDPVCGVRIDAEGRIGSLSLYRSYPPEFGIEGLGPGMALEAALQACPALHEVEDPDSAQYGIQVYEADTAAGDRLRTRTKNGVLLGIEIERPGLRYPERPYRRADPTLSTAFNLYCGAQRTLPDTDRSPDAWRNGWCFGRPPGIAGAQWPLSPSNGRPLRHAFTLVLPTQYRALGQDYPALSLFADEQFHDLPDVSGAPAESEPHPRKYAMTDALGGHYAAIWLTQAEFDGPLAVPPRSTDPIGTPGWAHRPHADYYGEYGYGRPSDREGRPHDWLPGRGLETAFPIGVLERERDPNVGKPAREWEHENEDSGYVPAFSEQGQSLGLDRFHGALAHLGGTLFPQQSYPPFSARVLEFEESFAGFNFGGGTAQLDLEQMKIDWACG